jgi:subtilisin
MGSPPDTPPGEPPDHDSADTAAADDESRGGLTPTRRRLLVGLLTGSGALGLGARARARDGAPGGSTRNAAGNNDQVTNGNGPPDRHVVGTSSKAATDEATRRAREVRHVLDFGDDVGKAVAGRFPEQARRALEKRSDVRYVEADGTVEAIGESVPWGIDRIDADVAHETGTAGAGADLAILDSGIDSDHPDLEENLGSGTAIVEAGTAYDGSSCSGNDNTIHEPWDDDNDHGTHCAGIAAAVDNDTGVIGVSKGATLHAVKVLDCGGTGYLSDIAAGLEYTADQGWDVASMSLGASSDSTTLRDACQYAVDNGVLPVAAAGNDGPCTDCVSYPAAYDTVVAVSSTDSSDSLSSFSSTGPEVDLAAPGESILSTIPGGTAYFSGTSMACPHVSGAGGLLMANGYSADEARTTLQGTAEDIGLSTSDGGEGLLDAEAAAADIQNMIGEANTISVDENWQTVTLEGTYTDPVVVTSVGTYNDADPVHARVRNAGSESFEVRLEEWAYQDGSHGSETVNYVVIEAGQHTTEAGMDVVAGTTTANGSGWTTVDYTSSWAPQSHVYTQVMSTNDATPTSTRITRTGAETFDVSCHEEEANQSSSSWTNGHADETVGYVATQPLSSADDAGTGESNASAIPTDAWVTNEFQESYSAAPVTVPRMQSFFGGNTTDLRMRNLSTSSFDVRGQEEKSLDDEVAHVPEYVATLAFAAGPINPE